MTPDPITNELLHGAVDWFVWASWGFVCLLAYLLCF